VRAAHENVDASDNGVYLATVTLTSVAGADGHDEQHQAAARHHHGTTFMSTPHADGCVRPRQPHVQRQHHDAWQPAEPDGARRNAARA
jgi:hypothetical protein